MDDTFDGKTVAFGDFGLPGRTAIEGFAFLFQFGASGGMDGSIDTASSQEGFIGGVDNGVNLLFDDIAFDYFDTVVHWTNLRVVWANAQNRKTPGTSSHGRKKRVL